MANNLFPNPPTHFPKTSIPTLQSTCYPVVMPKSPEGKARSSQNALKHGLSSKQVLLPTESAEDYNALRASYFDQFQPANHLEAELVQSLADTRWRLRRLATIETNLFATHPVERELFIPDQLRDLGDEVLLSWTFRSLANSGCTLQMLLRYEATLSRTFDRTFKQLQLLQNQRPKKLQNEPATPVEAPPNTQPVDPLLTFAPLRDTVLPHLAPTPPPDPVELL